MFYLQTHHCAAVPIEPARRSGHDHRCRHGRELPKGAGLRIVIAHLAADLLVLGAEAGCRVRRNLRQGRWFQRALPFSNRKSGSLLLTSRLEVG